MAVLVAFAATAFAALSQFNRFATASRLRVHALSLAQQRVDEILTTSWRTGAARPTVLSAGVQEDEGLTLNADELNEATGLGSLFTKLVTPVEATRTVEISNVNSRTVRATVTVAFTYANREYQVSLTTMRAIDTI